MEEHPNSEDFASLLQRSPRPSHADRNALVVRHLLARCEVCHTALRALPGTSRVLSRLFGVGGLPEKDAGASSRFNYEWAFARADRALANVLAQGKTSERLPEQLAALSRLPEGEQLLLVQEGGELADPQLIHCLLERSHAARYRSPRKTLHLSRLSHLAAEACTPEQAGGREQLVDLQVQALGAFANALRICGNLHEAEIAFAKALDRWAEGTSPPRIRAHLLSQVAALRTFQRRFDEALDLTEEATEICRGFEDSNLLAGLMVQKATALLYSGNAESAAEIIQKAIPLIDRNEDPYLFLAAHHNLARCNLDGDRPEEALALFYEARELYRDCKEPLILLRAVWQEGQLLREIGHLNNAEAALLRARQGFTEEGLAYEAAMVSLDLAEVYSRLGLHDKLQKTVAEALPIFKALHVGREVLVSLLQLQESANQVSLEPEG